MTTPQAGTRGFKHSRFGTFMLIGWTGEHPEDGQDMPFLLAYSLGDGEDGPEGVGGEARLLLAETGLPYGGFVPDTQPLKSMTLLVEGGQAVLTMPHVSTQYSVPPEWVQAARARGRVHFIFATRPWPKGTPGRAVTEDELREFVGDEEMLTSASHALLPVTGLQG